MRFTFSRVIIFILALIIAVPLAVVFLGPWLAPAPPPAPGIAIRVYVEPAPGREKSGLVTMELDEYLKGVVAAEMPSSFPDEALKAQAVAARTRAISQMRTFGGAGCKDHPGADICTDPMHDQAWISEAEFKKRVGWFASWRLWPKIKRAVDTTRGQVLMYAGRPIDAVFHSASGGATENAEDVWSEYVPYLRGVQSPFEKDVPAPYSLEQLRFSIAQLEKALGVSLTVEGMLAGARLGPMPAARAREEARRLKGFVVIDKSPTGRIKNLAAGDKVFSGKELRALLGLRSTLFTWGSGATKDEIVFETRGWGHGVGMSQWGAAGMGKRGFTYTQILHHFYTNVQLEQVY